MKLTDYVVKLLKDNGVNHVFGLTGGAAVHLFDSADRLSGMTPVFNHHEQAGAMAAEAYAKVRNGLGACFVTTGPGVTNALTGLCIAWQDSVPCVFISGQTRVEHTSRGKPVRQVGTQHLEVVPIVQSMTKYAVMVPDAGSIRYHLEKAVHLARTGRPGPVWIDLPLNLQWANVEPDALRRFDPAELPPAPEDPTLGQKVEQCLALLNVAKRPLVLVGYGVRLAHAEAEFLQFLDAYQVPFLTTWGAADLCDTDDPLYVGRPGIAGQRGANLAIQNCDLLIAIGSHLSIPITGTLFQAFAREAKRVVVNIDQQQLDFETVRVDLPIRCDAGRFLVEMVKRAPSRHSQDIPTWRGKCQRYAGYNQVPADWYSQKVSVNQYVFVDELSKSLETDDVVVVDGGGTNVYISFQALRLKKGQRVIMPTATAPMGSGLPEAIGACFAKGGGRTICLCGDGSFQLNVQELQTVFHHKLPIKLFIFNNDGYVSIRGTQAEFLEGNFAGSTAKGGMSLPDVCAVAAAYKLPTYRIERHDQIGETLKTILKSSGPAVCEVMISPDQKVVPTQGFYRLPDGTFRPRPLEDMAPLLDRKEFAENMLVPEWTAS